MAVSLGGYTNLASGTGTRSWTSPTTANKAYGVVVISGGAVDETSGVTWGGVAMSREYTGANTGGESGTTSCWFIDAPGTGGQTVEITRSGSTSYIATAFDGTSATGHAAVETGNTMVSTSTSAVPLNITVTNGVVVAVYGGLYSGENALSSITDAADMTRRHSQDFGNFVSVISQKTTTLTGTGSAYTGFNYTQSSDDAGAAVIAIREGDAPTRTVTLTALLDAGSAIYAPTVSPDQFVTLDLLDGASAIYAPTATAIGPAQSVTLGLLDAISAGGDTTVVNDTFTEAGTITIAAHTPDTGGSWSMEYQQATAEWKVEWTDIASFTDGLSDEYSTGIAVNSATVGDGYAQLQFTVGDGAGPVVRHIGTGASECCYAVYLGSLYRLTNGTLTSVASIGGTGNYYRLEATGSSATTLKVYRATSFTFGAAVVDTTDNTAANQTTTGKTGLIGVYDDYGNLGSSVDNFTAVEVGGGGGERIWSPTVKPINTLTLGLLDGGAAIYAPDVIPDRLVELGLNESTPAIYAPTATPTAGPAQDIGALDLLDGAAAIYDPTLTVGPVSIVLGLIDGGAAIYQPTVVPGAVAISLNLIDAGAAIYEPTVTAGGVSITLPLLDGAAAIYEPTVLPQPVTATLPLLDGGAQVFSLTVSPDQFLTLTLLDAGANIFALSATAGPATVTLGLLDAGSAIYAPTILPGAVAISLTLIDGGAAIYDPTLAVGPLTIVLPLIDGASAVFAPTVVPGAVGISLALLDGGAAIYQPTLASVAPTISLALLDGGASIFSPTVSSGAVQVTLTLLDGASAIYNPTLTATYSVSLTLLDGEAAIYALAASGGIAAIGGVPPSGVGFAPRGAGSAISSTPRGFGSSAVPSTTATATRPSATASEV